MSRRSPMLMPVPHLHDLPPKWDGEPVTWGEFGPPGVTFVCDRSKRTGQGAVSCIRCGSVRTESTSGRIAGRLALIVTRCSGCSLDTVVEVGEHELGEVWTLDYPDDYGDEGSVAP